MGQNLQLRCLTHRKEMRISRGDEAAGIKRFGKEHKDGTCQKVCSIDGGFEGMHEWDADEEGFDSKFYPDEYLFKKAPGWLWRRMEIPVGGIVLDFWHCYSSRNFI